MTLPLPRLLRSVAVVALMGAWAIAAYFGSAGQGSPDLNAVIAVTPAAVVVATLLWRARHPLWAAGGSLALLAALAWLWPSLRQNVTLLFFVEHLGVNLAFATLFGRTLVGPGEALITRFARIVHNGVLSERHLRYTRQLTLAWTLFFLANATLSALLYVAAPPTVWSFYANLLTAPLIGLMFAAEHLVRRRMLPPEERPSLAEVARVWRERASAKGS